jgi:hypothetical protein
MTISVQRHAQFASRVCKGLVAVVAFLTPIAPIFAQTFYGSIVGTVTDQSQAVIAGARVRLTNTGTAEVRTDQTDANGNYQFVNLVPGLYRVDVDSPGFKHLTHDQVQVQVQAAVRIDAALEVGDVGQTVEVTGQAGLLQTETSSLSQVVEGRTVQEMPLNGRNVMNLVALVPGVVAQGQAMGNPTNTNISAWGNYQIGGGFGNQSATLLDGAPLNTAYNNAVDLVPTQDSIQEFRVQTNNLGPEFGRFAGGVINMTTKSGTNEFHGTAYEFLRNKVLNSNTFFNNRSGIGTPAFTQNQFGADVGGPVIKDKTFFFVSYEGFRLRQGNSILTSVPTAAMRNGDFSNLRTSSGAFIPIYDPLTTCGYFSNPACASGQTVLRSLFPNNIIPLTRFDPTAQILKNLWAMPNLSGQQFTNVNNYATNAAQGGNNDQFNGRFDQVVSDKQRIFGRYTRWTDLNLPVDGYAAAQKAASLPQTGTTVDFQTVQAVLGDTYTFTPNTFGDIRLSMLRFTYHSVPQSLGISNLAQFGWPVTLNNQETWNQLPYPTVQGFPDFGQEVTGITANTVFSFAPSFVQIKGRHTIKAGMDLRVSQFNFGKSNQAGGVFNFDNIFTSANPVAPGSTGYGFASFLLGYGATGQIPGVTGSPNGLQTDALTASEFKYQGYYVSDTFQVAKRLTLNYGVRWDIPGAYTERYNRASVWLSNAVSPLAQGTGLPVMGELGLVDTAQSPGGRGITVEHWKLFAPRLGLAYRLTDKIVIRTGFGIFFLPSDLYFSSAPWSSPVNMITTPWVSTLNGGYTPNATLSNPFPNGILQPPGRNANYKSILYGTSVSSPLANQRYPYVQQWNFNIERQITDTLMVEAAYAGSRGVHLIAASGQIDQLPDQDLALGKQLQQLVSNPFYGLISTGTLANPTVQEGQLLLPYPQYTSVSVTTPSNRDSTYHSLQMKMEKRFHGGGTVLVAYTWAKLIGDTETVTSWLDPTGTIQDYNNLRLERSLSGSDVPQHVVISYVNDLPIGQGHRLLGNVSGVADKLVSGWGINGVTTLQRGTPLGFSSSSNITGSYNGGSRPNVIAGCDKSISGSATSRLTEWFNTACFTAAPAFTFGTEGRMDPNLHIQGIDNWDFAVFKTTPVTERIKLQFRSEFFNLFNRVQFAAPGLVQGNPSFGVVSSQANNPRLIQFALRTSF